MKKLYSLSFTTWIYDELVPDEYRGTSIRACLIKLGEQRGVCPILDPVITVFDIENKDIYAKAGQEAWDLICKEVSDLAKDSIADPETVWASLEEEFDTLKETELDDTWKSDPVL